MPIVLVVDDDAFVLNFVRIALERAAHTVITAFSGAEAFALVAKLARVDMLIVDHSLSPDTGRDVAERLLSGAASEGATFKGPLRNPEQRAFPSFWTVPERSSPSRVRFAAPNNGAPLTGLRAVLKQTSCQEGKAPIERWSHPAATAAIMSPFLTATDNHADTRTTQLYDRRANGLAR
jgi:hypothetical protein